MKLKRLQLLKRKLLLGCGICLITSCSTIPCSCTWAWKADPYEADSFTRSVTNGDGLVVNSDDGRFNNFTCFKSDNIAELKFNISRLKLKR